MQVSRRSDALRGAEARHLTTRSLGVYGGAREYGGDHGHAQARQLDGLGIAFDGEFLIDPSGTLPNGESFDGPDALKRLLLEEKEKFARLVAEKMLTYALGRGLGYYDTCAVDRIVDGLRQNDYRFSSLVLGIVQTTPFLMTRASSDP